MDNIINELNRKKETAFKKIYTEHFQSLSMFAHRYVADIDIAADLAQECFTRLWHCQEHFNSIENVKSYLYRIVRNLALDHIKHLKVEATFLNYTREQQAEQFKMEVMEEEIYHMLYKAIKTLPRQSRKIMILTMNGLSNKEIACKLNISVNTVKTLKQHSQRKLKLILKDYYYIFF